LIGTEAADMPPVLDQATVFTEFTKGIPADVSAAMRPHLAGPHAQLHRYGSATEKAGILLGAYNALDDTAYSWPARNSSSLVDQDYARVFIDEALLLYYQDLKTLNDTIAPVSGYKNRIDTDGARGFKTNGTSYPRIAALKDRDVAVGDIIKVVDGSSELTTYVAGLVAELVDPVTGAATSDDANAIAQPNSNPGNAPTVNATGGGTSGGALQAGDYYVRYGFVGPFGETWSSDATQFTQADNDNIARVTIPALPTGATSAKIYLSPANGAATETTLYSSGNTGTTVDLTADYTPGGAAYIPRITQTAGTDNGVNATAVSSASYNGSATGDITETYTITVTQASTGGNLTTARLQVTSASGRDDQTNVTPSATTVATAIGTRGLTVTWTRSADDFVIGQSWQVTVRQVWAVPVPTSSGTYTGAADITYIVKVSRGGRYADSTKPQISVTAAQGTDSSGPTTVTAAASDVAIGTLGINLQFSGAGLRKGDIYYVPVTGPSAGAYKTLILGNNLPTALQTSSDLDLYLYIKKNITVPQQRISSPPDLNWSTSASQITVNAGIDAYDTTLTDNGVQFPVPVKGGRLYAEYREWVADYAERITAVRTVADVTALFGADIHPDSMLPYAALQAVTNSNGQAVYFTAVADPDDTTAWTDVLAILEGLGDIFTLVPLSRNAAVLAAYRTHVVARSSDDIGGEWRHAWFNLAAVDSLVKIDATTSDDQEVVLATLADNPGVAGTQYTYLTVTSNNANFVTNGVAVGDVVRYLYGINAFGEETYTEFVVDSVVNEDTLILTDGYSAAVATAQRVEVWRNLTKTQIANNLAAQMTGDNLNKRFVFLWPDQVTDTQGRVVAGYFLCAAYAGMIGGMAPQQGLRNVQIKGFQATPRSTEFFNNGQLNILGNVGFFVVSTNEDGWQYAVYARTPDLSDATTREEATVRLDDAARYVFYNRAAGFFGKANTTDSAIAMIDAELKAAAQHTISDTRIDRIGSMLESASIKTLRRHLTVLDKLVVEVNAERGLPINGTTLLLIL
jgi:hypothetical protein